MKILSLKFIAYSLRLITYIILSLFTLHSSQLTAFSMNKDTGTTGANFLRLGVEARAVSMGEAASAVCSNSNAIHWNPACLVKVKEEEIGFTHSVYLEGVNFDFLSFARKGFGLGLMYLDGGKIIRQEENTDGSYKGENGNFMVRDMSLSVGYASRVPGADLVFGWAIKGIHQMNDKEEVKSFGLDIGGLYELSNIPIKMAFVFQNLGRKIGISKKEEVKLPRDIKIGIGYCPNGSTIAMDLNFPNDNRCSFSIGGEMFIGSEHIFAIRCGYKYTPNDSDTFSGLSGGFGLRFSDFRIDYAISSYGDLGSTQRVSLAMQF
ncbi:MAG: PorV/PorQ family protein [bacterium]|nr:PorV/PorQ family protein [bacterium]